MHMLVYSWTILFQSPHYRCQERADWAISCYLFYVYFEYRPLKLFKEKDCHVCCCCFFFSLECSPWCWSLSWPCPLTVSIDGTNNRQSREEEELEVCSMSWAFPQWGNKSRCLSIIVIIRFYLFNYHTCTNCSQTRICTSCAKWSTSVQDYILFITKDFCCW